MKLLNTDGTVLLEVTNARAVRGRYNMRHVFYDYSCSNQLNCDGIVGLTASIAVLKLMHPGAALSGDPLPVPSAESWNTSLEIEQ